MRTWKHGSWWITREKRLALYMRDGFACAYCGIAVEDGGLMSLDHLVPHCEGGEDLFENLITSCRTCNSARGNRDWKKFAKRVAKYRGIPESAIVNHIKKCLQRKVNVSAARSLIAQRGSYSNVISSRGK